MQCNILLKEIESKSSNSTPLATARLVVFLNDVNDNTPVFRNIEWHAEVPENAQVGTRVIRVEANDSVISSSSKITYTRLFGPESDAFDLNKQSGLITVAKSGLDAEATPFLKFFVEAADGDGSGNTATSTVTVKLLDVNDETPIFDKNPYEFIVNERRTAFTVPAFVKAVDNDISSPNNEVRYEFIEAVDNLTLDALTGEIGIKGSWERRNVTAIHVRAYDGGVPKLWSTTEIRLYPPESKFKTMMFIVKGRNPDRVEIARILSTIFGSEVTIDDVRPYVADETIANDKEHGTER